MHLSGVLKQIVVLRIGIELGEVYAAQTDGGLGLRVEVFV